MLHALKFLAVSAVLVVGLGAQADTIAKDTSLVVVELFTSQGCVACPPADKVLAKLSEDDNLLVLSWPVDYWDYLGWSDTFAASGNSKRQEDYNHNLGMKGVYTPQMVINGREHAVGSRETIVRKIVNNRKAEKLLELDVALEGDRDNISIKIGSGEAVAPATVWMLLFDEERVVDIRYGENRNRSLHYTNIVRQAINAGAWNGDDLTIPIDMDMIRASGIECIAILVQGGDAGPILGAAKLVLADLD